jgi:hypothetical protein
MLKDIRYFGGTFRLHLHNRRMIQAKNQHEAGSKKNQHGGIFQKRELFISTAVRTSNPTRLGSVIGLRHRPLGFI